MDKNFYQQLCEQETALAQEIKALDAKVDDLRETLDAVKLLRKRYKDTAPMTLIPFPDLDERAKKLIDPKAIVFDAGYTQYQKTYIALRNIKNGFSTDIAKELHRLDPKDFDEDKAAKVAREKASDLYNCHVFDIEKYGRKYKYSIKPEWL